MDPQNKNKLQYISHLILSVNCHKHMLKISLNYVKKGATYFLNRILGVNAHIYMLKIFLKQLKMSTYFPHLVLPMTMNVLHLLPPVNLPLTYFLHLFYL